MTGENQLNLDENNEFPFKAKRKDVDNLENLYRRVKICKSCFIVYSLAARYFDTQLKKDLQGDTFLLFYKCLLLFFNNHFLKFKKKKIPISTKCLNFKEQPLPKQTLQTLE